MINYLLFSFTLLFTFLSSSQNQLQTSINFNLVSSPTGFSPNILSFRFNNVRLKGSYELKHNRVGVELSLTSGLRSIENKNEPNFFSENYYLLDISTFYTYGFLSSNRHYLTHSIGSFLHKSLVSYSVNADKSTRFLESISLLSTTSVLTSKSSTYNYIYGFLETGYDFYVYKGLHLSLTGRATLLSYNLNYDSNGDPTDEKRLGLNYMLFYGLGYTFGRDE